MEFDNARGLGLVESADGTRHPFHCMAVADGSRSIEVGAKVAFVLRAGHRGRFEAWELTPLHQG